MTSRSMDKEKPVNQGGASGATEFWTDLFSRVEKGTRVAPSRPIQEVLASITEIADWPGGFKIKIAGRPDSCFLEFLADQLASRANTCLNPNHFVQDCSCGTSVVFKVQYTVPDPTQKGQVLGNFPRFSVSATPTDSPTTTIFVTTEGNLPSKGQGHAHVQAAGVVKETYTIQ